MPIKPENKWFYPKDWPEIRERILQRAGNKCEWCGVKNGEPHPETGARVVLTIMHLNHIIGDCSDDNLKAACQLCHNRYDREHRNETRQKPKNEQLLLGEIRNGL